MRNWKGIGAVVGILGLFVLTSYLAQRYQSELINLVQGRGLISLLTYLLVEIVGVVVAPINTIFFIPVGVALWGVVGAALLSLFGWTVGSLIAYQLAHLFGRPILRRLGSLRQAKEAVRRLPQSNLFWGIVALRVLVPADLLSYALGLFTPIVWWRYTLATFIGYIPSAVVYVYAATIPLAYQIMGVLLVLGLILFTFLRRKPQA